MAASAPAARQNAQGIIVSQETANEWRVRGSTVSGTYENHFVQDIDALFENPETAFHDSGFVDALPDDFETNTCETADYNDRTFPSNARFSGGDFVLFDNSQEDLSLSNRTTINDTPITAHTSPSPSNKTRSIFDPRSLPAYLAILDFEIRFQNRAISRPSTSNNCSPLQCWVRSYQCHESLAYRLEQSSRSARGALKRSGESASGRAGKRRNVKQ